jgi:arylsulfatase
MFGNRGIYHKGWTAVTRHRTPWILTGQAPPFNDDVWELYDTNKDWTQAHDLSKQMPEKLHELQRLWIIEATRNNVLPMDDRGVERFNAELAGRPALVHGTSQILARGMGGLNENTLINLKNKSFSVTAQVIIPEGKSCEGVILSQGGFPGGWIFYVKNGRLTYCYNYAGAERYVISSSQPLPSGSHQVRMEFAYDGGGLGKGGTVTLYIDGNSVGSGRVEKTLAIVFSADETADVGIKRGSPITPDLSTRNNEFTGTVQLVVIETDTKEPVDHLISHEQLLHILMARQ